MLSLILSNRLFSPVGKLVQIIFLFFVLFCFCFVCCLISPRCEQTLKNIYIYILIQSDASNHLGFANIRLNSRTRPLPHLAASTSLQTLTGFETREVTWCFTLSQPLRLYPGEKPEKERDKLLNWRSAIMATTSLKKGVHQLQCAATHCGTYSQ